MARKVIHTAHEPAIYTTPHGDTVKICRCGLTHNELGICDDSHKQTLDEKDGDIYAYDMSGMQGQGCCGGGCCSE